ARGAHEPNGRAHNSHAHNGHAHGAHAAKGARSGESRSESGRRPSRRSRRGSPYAASPQLTSMPPGRAAYADTRTWVLAGHGPVCAYCGERFAPRSMTLDHVAPRRGQTAYDRRDNLVLACKACNAAKRDLAPIAFLLAKRTRAVHLLRYGSPLSPMLVELARSLAPAELELVAPNVTPVGSLSDDESPYKD